MRVLILDGHSRAALESLQSLGRLGAKVDIASAQADCLAFASRRPLRRLAQPDNRAGPEAVRDWVVRQFKSTQYDFILPSTESSLQAMRLLDPAHPVRRRAAIPSDEALDIALDKGRTYALAASLGIPVPPTVTIPRRGTPPARREYPVVLKAQTSYVGMPDGLRRAETTVCFQPAERERLLTAWLPHTDVQEQDFVFGRGVGIEMLFDRGRPIWHFAHERLHESPLTGGASSYRRSIAPPRQLLDMATRLLSALGWHGVAMVEFRCNGEQAWLMEINPRLWGSVALAIDSGVDFPAALARLAVGAWLPPQPAYRIGYRTRDITSDLAWQRTNLLADRSNPHLLTRSPPTVTLEMLRPLAGIESWDHFDWRDPPLMRRLLHDTVTAAMEPVTRRVDRHRLLWSARAGHRRLAKGLASRPPRRILFLCYGNICRSPLAAALAAGRLPGVEVESAGFHERTGREVPEFMRAATAKIPGLRLESHRSRRVDADMLRSSDLVVCMDADNVAALQARFPESRDKTALLGLWCSRSPGEISDPWGAPADEVAAVVDRIADGVEGLTRAIRGDARADHAAPGAVAP